LRCVQSEDFDITNIFLQNNDNFDNNKNNVKHEFEEASEAKAISVR
jgi:hypothetical protein